MRQITKEEKTYLGDIAITIQAIYNKKADKKENTKLIDMLLVQNQNSMMFVNYSFDWVTIPDNEEGMCYIKNAIMLHMVFEQYAFTTTTIALTKPKNNLNDVYDRAMRIL